MKKTLSQYDGLPTVTAQGQIYFGNTLARTSLTPNNYLRVGMYINGTYVERRVHTLTAEAFIPNPEKCYFITHLDGNRLNNEVSNLKWTKDSADVTPETPEGKKAVEEFKAQRVAEKEALLKERKRIAKEKKLKNQEIRQKVRDLNRGENSVHSVLTQQDVDLIRDMAESGQYRQKDIAEEFGVTPMNIHKIVTRKTWKPVI